MHRTEACEAACLWARYRAMLDVQRCQVACSSGPNRNELRRVYAGRNLYADLD
jgi:hypothetical protein